MRETIISLLEIGDEVFAKILRSKIAKTWPDKLPEFIALQNEVGLNNRDKLMVGKSVDALAKKYAILTEFGPEILLVIFMAQYGLRQARLYQFVTELETTRKGKPAALAAPAEPVKAAPAA